MCQIVDGGTAGLIRRLNQTLLSVFTHTSLYVATLIKVPFVEFKQQDGGHVKFPFRLPFNGGGVVWSV